MSARCGFLFGAGTTSKGMFGGLFRMFCGREKGHTHEHRFTWKEDPWPGYNARPKDADSEGWPPSEIGGKE